MTDFKTKTDINSRRRVKNNNSEQQLMDIGKIPPQAIELEEAVLGAVMLEQNAINIVIDILKPESFYKDANARIFTAAKKLFSLNHPVDILTITQELKRTGELEIVGGAYYITQLTNRVASSANVEHHARIVAQKYIAREIIRTSTDNIRDAYEESTDCFDLLDTAERNLFAISQVSTKKDVVHASTIIKEAVDELEQKQLCKPGTFGVPSGLTALDRITSGWQKSDLVIIAARPAMGKTALVLTMARNAAVEFKRPTAVFSLEMSSLQLISRLISSETEINGNQFKKVSSENLLTDAEWERINNKTVPIANSPLFIDDTPGMSIFELRAKARRLKENHDIQLIIIDYLQLMKGDRDRNWNGNREQEIAEISRSLKSLAKELNVPVIALSQLSRAVETRGGDKRPVLSDLRESGAIEQDADIVMFIHRPEYYNITQDSEGNSTIGKGELIIAKHRNGPIDSAYVQYIASQTKFCDIDDFSTMTFEEKLSNLTPNTSFINPSTDDDQPF